MKSYAIVLSAIILSACGSPPGTRSDGMQVSREVRAKCQREAMTMYPVALKMGGTSGGAMAMTPPHPTTAFDPAPPASEDTNATARLDMINACLRTGAGEKK
jgi:hypothetical protein